MYKKILSLLSVTGMVVGISLVLMGVITQQQDNSVNHLEVNQEQNIQDPTPTITPTLTVTPTPTVTSTPIIGSRPTFTCTRLITRTPTTQCNSDKIYDAQGLANLSVRCGDRIKLYAEYKPSTGYDAFPPKYDSTYLKLIKMETKKVGTCEPGQVGCDLTRVIYTFQTIARTQNTVIQVGIHREWDSSNTKTVQQTLNLKID